MFDYEYNSTYQGRQKQQICYLKYWQIYNKFTLPLVYHKYQCALRILVAVARDTFLYTWNL